MSISTIFTSDCVDGEMEVHTEHLNDAGENLCRIDELQTGDKVLSRCVKTGAMEYKRVVRVMSRGFQPLCNLVCEYGPEVPRIPGLPGPLFAGEEQPFWVNGKGWLAVRDLRPGNELQTFNGVKATLKSISPVGQYEAFTIEVEDFNTYFAHWTGLWVHGENSAKDENP